jgi:hypothetical protein
MSILKKRKRIIGEKFPMTRPIAQIREELKQKPLDSKQPGNARGQSGIVSVDEAERVCEIDLFKHALAVPDSQKNDVGQPGDGPSSAVAGRRAGAS